MKWMKDPLAGFISRCSARMVKFTELLVTIAMLAGTTGAGATAFADETVTDGGNVAAESAASQPESTQQSDAENAVGSDVADIAGQDVAGQSATDDDDAQCLTDDGESHQPSNEQAQSQLQSQSQPEQPSETMPEQRQPCDKTEQPNEQKEQERQAVRQPTAENADVPANDAAPAQDGDRNDHAGENRTHAYIENGVMKPIRLLAEGHAQILERLPGVGALDSLRGRVCNLERMVTEQGHEIDELKRA